MHLQNVKCIINEQWAKWAWMSSITIAYIQTQTAHKIQAQNKTKKKIAILLAENFKMCWFRADLWINMVDVIKFNCRRTSQMLIALNKTIDGIICHGD